METPIHPKRIIQVNPEHKTFAGCLMVVTKTYEWGVQAAMILPNEATTYVRLKWDEIEAVNVEPVWVYDSWIEES